MHLRDLVQFLAELSENNNRAWFVMNKPRYDILRAEFLDLVTGLIADLKRFDPAVAACNPKKALFRINRDMRFSHDKSPYKTHFSAAITASGLKKPSQGGGPSYYFHVNSEGTLLIAGGEYMPPSDRVRAIRQRIVADPAGFSKLLKNRKLLGTFGSLQEEGKLIRPPKGFESDSPHVEYLKLKSFIVWKEMSLKKKLPTDLQKDLAMTFKDAWPLIDWLRQVPPPQDISPQ
ncbi:MAG: hypothetical protein JWR21_3253 [Herminiimonas sp.]|nr:hypothetical protein [Herminiimonas sp.]